MALTVVIGAVLASYVGPLIGFVQQYRGASGGKAHLHELVLENKRLHARVRATNHPVLLVREARREGMVLPGERAYVVHGLRG